MNHPELVQNIYNKFIFNDSRLIPLARERAALKDWSKGGWPDVFGGSVMGMSCGPTKDWDHDYGCPVGFGGFQGLAFVSCTGPFHGMECSFDDGTRFVAGLVATPMIQYYDGTQDQWFLKHELVPFLKDVAHFYTSYSIPSPLSSSLVELPFTCAQETCNGASPDGDGKGEEYNSNADISFATMAYQRLLQYTANNTSSGGGLATKAERKEWSDALRSLPPIPLAVDPVTNNTVFAEAKTRYGKQPAADTNAEYSISHLAAIHPSQSIQSFRRHSSASGAGSASLKDDQVETTLKIAQNTVEMINRVTSFAPGNGFCLNWNAAALVHQHKNQSNALLENFSNAYVSHAKPNGWPDLKGGGLEEIGAVDALRMLMVRIVDGVLHLFVGIPFNAKVSFHHLRVEGAFLISATNGVSSFEILSEVGRPLLIPKDVFGDNESSGGMSSMVLCQRNSSSILSTPLKLEGLYYLLETSPGETLVISPCGRGGGSGGSGK